MEQGGLLALAQLKPFTQAKANNEAEYLKGLQFQQLMRQERQDEMASEMYFAQQQEAVNINIGELQGAERDAMLEKAQYERKLLMEEVKKRGGYNRFLSTGGAVRLQEYRNNIVGSQEFMQYKENKTNLQKIAEIAASGNMTLMSERSLQNYKDYQNGITDKIYDPVLLQPVEQLPDNSLTSDPETNLRLFYEKNQYSIRYNMGLDRPSVEQTPESLLKYTYERYGNDIRFATSSKTNNGSMNQKQELEEKQRKRDLMSNPVYATNQVMIDFNEFDWTGEPGELTEFIKDSSGGLYDHMELVSNEDRSLTVDINGYNPASWHELRNEGVANALLLDQFGMADEDGYIEMQNNELFIDGTLNQTAEGSVRVRPVGKAAFTLINDNFGNEGLHKNDIAQGKQIAVRDKNGNKTSLMQDAQIEEFGELNYDVRLVQKVQDSKGNTYIMEIPVDNSELDRISAHYKGEGTVQGGGAAEYAETVGIAKYEKELEIANQKQEFAETKIEFDQNIAPTFYDMGVKISQDKLFGFIGGMDWVANAKSGNKSGRYISKIADRVQTMFKNDAEFNLLLSDPNTSYDALVSWFVRDQGITDETERKLIFNSFNEIRKLQENGDS